MNSTDRNCTPLNRFAFSGTNILSIISFSVVAPFMCDNKATEEISCEAMNPTHSNPVKIANCDP